MRFLYLAVCLLLLAPSALAQQSSEQPSNQPPEGAIVAPVGHSAQDIRQTLQLPGATWYNDRNTDKLFDKLEERYLSNPGQRAPIIATFVEGVDVDDGLAAARDVVDGLEPHYVYRHLGGFAAHLYAHEAEAIAALPEVRQVEWSQPGQPELDSATETMGVRTVQEALRPPGQPTAPPGIRGDGVTIAIMDTGFDGNHSDLAGQIRRFIDWSNNGQEGAPYDSGTHGTHVASIAVGLGAGNPDYTGVAPGADMIGFQISTNDTKAAALASVDWLLAHPEEGVRVATISFGFGVTMDGTDALELAMDRLWESGVVTFKSAGNGGPAIGTVTIPGGARGILATGAIYDPGEGGLRMRETSSRGPTDDGRIKPDVSAPGANIMAAAAGTRDGYRLGSGTSMASPFAAGVAALMISSNPQLEPADVRRILSQTVWDRGPAGPDIDWGVGHVDALRAVQQVLLERAISEARPWAEVQAWNVTGPPFLGQVRLELMGPTQNGTIGLPLGGHSLGLTAISDGLLVPGRSAQNRAIWVTAEAPDGAISISPALTPHRRQVNLNWPTAGLGDYDVRATGIDGFNGTNIDVIGLLPLAENPYVLPADAAAYQAQGGPPAGASPVPTMLAVGAGFAFLVWRPRVAS